MITVLIADDEWIERAFLRKTLEAYPDFFQVIGEASTGTQAVELSRRHRPDVSILDINMPQMGGLEATREIRAFAPSQVIILNSAYAEFSFAQQAIYCDIDAYLLKPSQGEELLETISACVQKRRRRSAPAVSLCEDSAPQTSCPFDLTDAILSSVAQRNVPLGRELFSRLLQYLRDHRSRVLSYRLFLINFLFSLQRELVRAALSEPLWALLNCRQALSRLESAEGFEDIFPTVESFGERLFFVLEAMLSTQESGGLQAAARYIDQHFTEQITLERLSQVAFLSPSYLSRMFRLEYGESIRSCIARKRMELAQELLRASDLPIKKISQECGFNSLPHFYRAFSNFTGVTPSAFRRNQ